jgi:predicted AAA+ superfamily ATPase
MELDDIVNEVRESEEWEAVRMDLIDIGISQGELKNLILLIAKKKAKNLSVEETADMLETDSALVQKVYDALETYAADTQWEDIIKVIN